MALTAETNQGRWRNELVDRARGLTLPYHGIPHCHRVYACSKWLLGDTEHDDDALFAAAFLNAMGRAAEPDTGVLLAMGFPPKSIGLVVEAIIHHAHDSVPGKAPEAVAFRDAHTLDLLGPIGISRLLSAIGRHPLAPDLPGAIATLQRYRRDLPKALVMPEAQLEGHTRCREMDQFFTGLSRQTYGMTRL